MYHLKELRKLELLNADSLTLCISGDEKFVKFFLLYAVIKILFVYRKNTNRKEDLMTHVGR